MDVKEKINAYLENTKDKSPSVWLTNAVQMASVGEALDLGCGAGRDTKFLLEKGFIVTAVDSNPDVEKYLRALPHQERLHVIICRFADIHFLKEQYTIVNASFSLPFAGRDVFHEVFKNITDSLKIGGVFVGQLFGVHDDWNKSHTSQTMFHAKEAAEALFAQWDVVRFVERDHEGTLNDGMPKHWHTFHILARKIT